MMCLASFSDQILSPVIMLEATFHLLRSGGDCVHSRDVVGLR
jgi:hypothetical protein